MIYPGRYIRVPENIKLNSLIEKVWLNTSTGKVEAWFIPVKNADKKVKLPAVIFAHGNYEVIDYNYQEALRYNNLGIHVMLVEYPGYGRSSGSPSQDKIEEVFLKSYDWLVKKQNVDKGKIIGHGRSLGGGPVCILASKRKINVLILQSTFTNMKQFSWKYFAPPVLVKDPFDNISVVRVFNGPILFFHGQRDDIIPYKNSVKLHNAAKNGRLVSLNCGHNDCPVIEDEFWNEIKIFLMENNLI